MRRFGVSTHLFDGRRLQRDDLTAIAGHGFDAIELFTSERHFDCHDSAAVAALAAWLRDAGLEMPSMHARIDDVPAALEMARHISFAHLIVHLEDMSRDAAIRRLEEYYRIAEPLGVTLALEIINSKLAAVDALVDLIENDLEGMNLGICMDVGHAFLSGDPAEAIETAGGYILSAHLHDNTRRNDDHLVPFQGAIDWPATVMAFEKIGYDGVFMFDVKSQQSAEATLERCARARRRLEVLAGSWELEAGSFSSITYVDQIAQHEGKSVTIRGWLHNRRSSGKIHFLSVRDGTGFIQAIVSKATVGEEKFKAADHMSQETAIVIHGAVRADSRAPGGFELDVSDFEIVSGSVDYPITPKEHGVDYLLDRRHLWIRSERQQSILRIRHEVISAVRDFFNDRGFILADTPIFTPAACEGTTTLFPVDYFEDQKVFLTQSGQLYAEANAMALGRVYNFGPVFRAEKSKTRRHLTEFWMVEPEMAYATLDDVIDLAEGLVVAVVSRVLDKRRRELKVLERDVTKLEAIQAPFPRISYDEAVKILNDKGQAFEWGGDLGAADETTLSQHFDRPVAIHRYPATVKPFYMESDPQRPELALCVDVLAPEGVGEIIGGSQRLASYDVLLQRIKDHNLPQEAFEWYLDLRRFGSVPHAGFGMGIERVVGWICGLEHVRESIPFPRMMYRVTP